MANTFLKAETIVNTTLGILQREIILPRTVTTLGRDAFTGAANDTVTFRVPAIATSHDYEWRTRTAPITIDDLTETGVDVTLDKHPYSAVAITDEQLTLDIASFGAQVLNPQARAVGERLEGYIAAELAAGTYVTSVPFAEGTDDPYLVLVEARRALNAANVPMSDRYVVMGSDVEAAFLSSDRITKAQNAGDTIASAAISEATLGRVAGFTLVTSNALGADEAYAYHRSAVVLGNVAPVVPEGVTAGATSEFAGLALRWIRDYDPNYLRDRSVVSSFAGVSLVDDGAGVVRAVKITFTPAV